MDRVKTGVNGLDELLSGGIPRGGTVLLAGGPGTCKSILGMTFIYEGAKKFNEPGVFISLEGSEKNFVWDMESFSWDIAPLQERELVKIHRLHINSKEDIQQQVESELQIIAELVAEMKAKRLVVDSTTAFGIFFQNKGVLRNALYEFISSLKELECTTMLIAETSGKRDDFSSFGVEEFVSDGVVALYFSPPNRSIFIRKMRGTNHSKKVHPFSIGNTGIVINPKDEMLWDAIK